MKKYSALPRWLRLSLIAGGGLMLAFWLLGRFWLPEFARQKAVALLSETLHRPVAIGAVEIRPFALGVTIRQLSIGQREAAHGETPLLAFDSFSLNLSSASLWYRAPVISEISLAAPRVHLIRDPDGRFNFSDLLDASPADPAAKPATGLPDFSLSNIVLSDGRISFDDRQQKLRHTITELAFGVPFAGTLGTQEENWVEPHFRARIDDSLFELKGRVKPFADRREASVDLQLKDFDLTRVMAYVPPVEGLRLLSARLDADLDLVFVQAPGKPFSLKLSGSTALRRLALENRGGGPYLVAADRIGINIDELDASLQKPIKAGLAIDQLSLRAQGAKLPSLVLPKLEATQLAVDPKARRIDLAALDITGFRAVLQREKDGQIDLVRFLVPPASPEKPVARSSHGDGARLSRGDSPRPKEHPGNATANSDPAAAPGWQGGVGRVTLKEAALGFADLTLDKAPPLVVDGIVLTVQNIDLAGKQPAALDFSAAVNKRGRLAVKGTAAWAPLAVALTLDVRELDLVPLQGWAGDRLNAVLSRGALSIGGQLALSGQPVVARFDGEAKLGNLNLFDRQHAADVLNFRSVDLTGVRLVSAPLSVNIQRLSLDELFARAILGADGELNFKQLVKQPPAPAGEAAPVESPARPAAAKPEAAQPLPVKIGEIVIRKSRVDFTDRFIKPPYSVSLSGLEGKVTALAAGQRGLIDLRGLVDRAAPLAISGELDPFSSVLFLNVAARVKGIEMPAMSPYAERYLGYELSKGKLSFDVKYQVEQGQLKAENSLFLDQLTFGNKVDSPEALGVPVTLAVALLKNTRGEIDLNLPLAGSLNDPEFSVARIVFKVLGNLIVKAVSSPFALLGAAFGGGEELSQVDFAAGRAAPEGDGEKRLQALAKALLERPGLTLEITGHADPERDRSALALALLERRLKARKVTDSAQKGQDSAALRDLVLSPEERLKGLQALALEQGLSLPKDAPASAYEAALIARQPVGDDELRQLAERRGRAVRNWLVDTGKVPVERVFVMTSKVDRADGTASPGRAAFALR